MEENEIEYIFNPDHFREFCDSTGGKSIFTYPPTKFAIRLTVMLFLFTIISGFISYLSVSISWIFITNIFLTGFAIIYCAFKLFEYSKWRRKINKYIEDILKDGNRKIVVSENAIKTEYDFETYIERWEDVRSTHIQKDVITFQSGSGRSYYFIAKSMKNEDYERLQALIKNKMK